MTTTTRWIAAVLVGLTCAFLASPALAQRVPLPTLFSERARFAERPVTVEGMVTFASAPGGGGQRFTLMDGGATVDVAAVGGLPVKVGDRVEVEGTYKAGPHLIHAFRVTLR
jgi:hypothetical protein